MLNLVNVNSPSVSLSVSASSANVALSGVGDVVMIDNTVLSGVDCFVKSGMSGVTATTSDMHISANEKASYAIDPSHTHIAAITSAGTTTLRIARSGGV